MRKKGQRAKRKRKSNKVCEEIKTIKKSLEKDGIKVTENKDEGKTKLGNVMKKKPKKRFSMNTEKQIELSPQISQEIERRTHDRDQRTLYIRFPASLVVCQEEDVQKFVERAVNIRLPRLSPGHHATYCYVGFKSEEEAVKMKEELEKLEVNGEHFYVDYVGEKSKSSRNNSEKESKSIDPKKLYIGCLPRDTTLKEIKEAFPTSENISYRKGKMSKVYQSYAVVSFKEHEEALRVFNASKDLEVNGKEVLVLFAEFRNRADCEDLDSSAPAKKLKRSSEEDH